MCPSRLNIDSRIQAAIACSERIKSARREIRVAAEQRREVVRELRSEGWTYGAIAEAMGCSRSAVQSIVRGTD